MLPVSSKQLLMIMEREEEILKNIGLKLQNWVKIRCAQKIKHLSLRHVVNNSYRTILLRKGGGGGLILN